MMNYKSEKTINKSSVDFDSYDVAVINFALEQLECVYDATNTFWKYVRFYIL